ncbi:MAG: HAD hydrolase-like protein [Magnetococcales bacterium]|nr:HAD hydrolase-like protein [Magnetococcales bacterium]
MTKPPLPAPEILDRYISRYRQMVCQGAEKSDLKLRSGAMRRVSLVEIASHYSWIWLDAYGVLNRGTEPVPGAGDTLLRLRRAGIPLCLVSNNATHSPSVIQSNLETMGITVGIEEIVTSGQVIQGFVRQHGFDNEPYLWVGSIASAHHYAPEPQSFMVNHPQSHWGKDSASYVLFSGNQEYYGGPQEQIFTASAAQRSLNLLVVNADLVAPEPLGSTILVTGYTACEVSMGNRHPLLGLGKPFQPVFDHAWKHCGCPPRERVLMVGDALETDILGAAVFGVDTCLTLSGLYGDRNSELEQICRQIGIVPDYIVPSIAWKD